MDATIENTESTEKTYVRLEEKLQVGQLREIVARFEAQQDEVRRQNARIQLTGHRKPEKRRPGLTLEEFKDLINQVLASSEYDGQLDNMFARLDVSGDGLLDVSEFCQHMRLYLADASASAANCKPVQVAPRHQLIVPNRQDTTAKIVSTDNPTRHVTVGKEGALCVWNGSLFLEKHSNFLNADDGDRFRVKQWVTDAVFMANCRRLAIASTSRAIHFYDVTTATYFEEFILYGLANVPCCFDYHFPPSDSNGPSLLVFGDDVGCVRLLEFAAPKTSLFKKPQQDRRHVVRVYAQQLLEHRKFVRDDCFLSVQTEMVKRVKLLADNMTCIASSMDPHHSLVVYDLVHRRKNYVFQLSKGVECFDYNRQFNFIVTGSGDHLVRVWNTYVTKKPTTVYQGHAAPVIDVAIHNGLGLIVSYSSDRTVKMWHPQSHSCVQTLNVPFPTSMTGKLPQHGNFPMCLSRVNPSHLLVASNDYVALVRLAVAARRSPTSSTPYTHAAPVSCILYVSHYNTVISAADDSSIALWDVNTGTRSRIIHDAHCSAEVTCLAVDSTGKRFISGSRDGDLAIWSVQNGELLQRLLADFKRVLVRKTYSPAEVTGAVNLTLQRRVIVTAGWNRKLLVYDDLQSQRACVEPMSPWSGDRKHRDDILCICELREPLLATSGYDGSIYVWRSDTQKLEFVLREGGTPPSGLRTRTPNVRQSARHRSRPERDGESEKSAASVDKLCFLRGRCESAKRYQGALLVSSSAGSLAWWRLYCLPSQEKLMGEFQAASTPDDDVLALSSDAACRRLACGDTCGTVSVYDVAAYCTDDDVAGRRPRSGVPAEAPAAPRLLQRWSAHRRAVVACDWVERSSGAFLLTASTDRTVKLWTSPEGSHVLVGIFGQEKAWDLLSPATWAGEETCECENGFGDEDDVASSGAEEERLGDDEDFGELSEQQLGLPDGSGGCAKIRLRDSGKNMLGSRVQNHLESRQLNRQSRRNRLNCHLEANKLSSSANCNPFHTIATKSLSAFSEIPKAMHTQN